MINDEMKGKFRGEIRRKNENFKNLLPQNTETRALTIALTQEHINIYKSQSTFLQNKYAHKHYTQRGGLEDFKTKVQSQTTRPNVLGGKI